MTLPPPAFAPTIHHDASTLWLSFPAVPGSPAAVMAFSLTEGGLAKALKAIRKLPSTPDPRILGLSKAPKGVIPLPRVTRARVPETFSPELRAATRDILRRLKVGA